MKPSDNWRSVFSLSQSGKKKKKKTAKPAKGSPSPSPPLPQTNPFPDPSRTSQAPRRNTMSGPTPAATLPVQSPDSDVSPKTGAQAKDEAKADYFSSESQKVVDEEEADESEGKKGDTTHQLSRATTQSSIGSTESSPVESTKSESRVERQRGASISSLAFAPVRNTSLPQGNQKTTNKERIRASSPPPERFQRHVAFDNAPVGEATKNNAVSLTLTVRHKGYQAQRRSRTFMVGVDEHAYSDYALQWLLNELVDDGDEVVCVRVIEKEMRYNEKDKSYQDEAKKIMASIVERNGANRALSIVLEYAWGKLHSTFQMLIQMHQPAMLIVGTRGRSLGGLQGLVNTRNSFSKYCLQYSPVPVVVVRPTEKREKKKNKRQNDSERQNYIKMLAATGGKHEADSERSSMYEVEVHNTADEEAHQVAKALGLPAAFDPTIKPVDLNSFLQPRGYTQVQSTTPSAGKAPASTAGDSDDDEDDDEDEFEVVTGEQAINDSNQKEKLHKMEVGEAAALLKQNRKSSLDSTGKGDDDDDDESK